MKRTISVLAVMALMLCMVSCGNSGGSSDEPETNEAELAMIADSEEMNEGSFADVTWDAIETFAADNALTAKCYKSEKIADTEKEENADSASANKDNDKGSKEDDNNSDKTPATKEESYMMAVDKAVENKAKLIVMAGSGFETTAYAAQSEYPDVYFLLIDGVPHDSSQNYATEANTIGVVFAEEEAGYLAGYAAVKDGYSNVGFMGGEKLPAIKRYGYGFVQGVAAAAAELEKKVELTYMYTGTSEASKDIRQLAADRYKDGTQVIFACGGNIGTSVMKAAEKNGGKVIGSGVDQSYLSSAVITSAKSEVGVVVEEMLDNYVDDKFVGGTAFNYDAANKGVSLEMENAQFNRFSDKDYNKVLKQLRNGKIQLKKDTGVGSVSELAGEWVTIKQ